MYVKAYPAILHVDSVKQQGSNGITKTPWYMGKRRGLTPYKRTNEKAINYL
jgi:hypothetical protein